MYRFVGYKKEPLEQQPSKDKNRFYETNEDDTGCLLWDDSVVIDYVSC